MSEPIPTREPRFQCIRCGLMCQDTRGLSNHQTKCNVDPRFSCKFCQKMCSSAQTLYRHEDKCKALRSAQLEMDKINQIETLTNSLKEKESELTLFQEQIIEFQTQIQQMSLSHQQQIQEMNITIEQLKETQRSQDFQLSSSDSTIKSLNRTLQYQLDKIDSLQQTIIEKNTKINRLEEEAKEDRWKMIDLASRTIELRKQYC